MVQKIRKNRGGETVDSIYREIEELKKEKDAVILAHYYVPGEVQACADYIGDSFLSEQDCHKAGSQYPGLCGGNFHGRECKNPEP